jgi:imidazolonepropionase-like amidohydrolase
MKDSTTPLPIVLGLAAMVVASAGPSAPPTDESAAAATAYLNGQWYDGSGFVDRVAYVRDGKLVEAPPGAPGATVDLEGSYVLPAFAEAHHHMVLCEPGRIDQFIDAGVLYAAVMNARVSSRACQAEMHGVPGVEILSSLAGITATDAHPSQIGLYFLAEDEIDGEWVHFVDDDDDLDRVWPRLLASPPDLVKIFLSYSEDFARLRNDDTIASWYRGMDPALVSEVVRRGHAMGLRVAAHVMSAYDFEVAVDGGVDLVAHLPGFAPDAAFTDDPDHPYLSTLSQDPGRYRISPEVATQAAARGIGVVTTISGGPPTPDVAHNIETLRAADVTLLIGSDRGEFHSVDEAVYLVEEGLLPAREVVHSLAVTTTQFLFPARTVGTLETGAEATFVALRGDPLSDIANLRDPRWVVKQGTALRAPE